MKGANASQSDELIGTVVQERYRVISRIGQGGMGVVYEVEHVLIGRRFALKTLDPMLSRDAEVLARFRREAKAAAAIGNEHIIEVNDMGKLPSGSPYIVLEFLQGRSLRDEIEASGPLPISRAVEIARQCCEALGSAHEKGIVHRDIKPDNVFLVEKPDGSDFVKILDFGISKFREAAIGLEGGSMTKTGAAIGTPYYMSPEQASGLKDIDERTDVYAMGVVLYEMLIGQVPFLASTYPLLVVKILQDAPPSMTELRSDIPLDLQQLVFRALLKQPADRFSSITEFASALAPFANLAGKPELTDSGLEFAKTAKPDTTPGAWEGKTNTQEPASYQRKLTILGAMAGAVILGLGALVFYRMFESEQESLNTTDSQQTVRSPQPVSPQPSALPKSSESFPPTEGETKPTEDEKLRQNRFRDLPVGLSTPSADLSGIEPKRAVSPQRERVAIKSSSLESKIYKESSTARSRSSRDHSISSREEPTAIQVVSPSSSSAKVSYSPTPTSSPIRIPATASAKTKPAPPATRNIRILNQRRASVDVTLKCGGESKRTSVSPKSRISIEVPQQDCQVVCNGVGQPICPVVLRASKGWMEIR